jgi:hypothetical protein
MFDMFPQLYYRGNAVTAPPRGVYCLFGVIHYVGPEFQELTDQ